MLNSSTVYHKVQNTSRHYCKFKDISLLSAVQSLQIPEVQSTCFSGTGVIIPGSFIILSSFVAHFHKSLMFF